MDKSKKHQFHTSSIKFSNWKKKTNKKCHQLLQKLHCITNMTGWKNCALQVPPVVPYKVLEKFSKALYGTTGGTCSTQFSHPIMSLTGFQSSDIKSLLFQQITKENQPKHEVITSNVCRWVPILVLVYT